MNPKTHYPAEGPVEAARAMKHEPGFVFLDSALPGDGSISILACKPDLVLRGRNWELLEQELNSRRREGKGNGIPDGAAIGWVAYDGEFHFSFYDQLHVYSHDAGAWIVRPEKFHEPAAPVRSANLDFKPLLGRAEF